MEEFAGGWLCGIFTAFVAYLSWAYNWFDGLFKPPKGYYPDRDEE